MSSIAVNAISHAKAVRSTSRLWIVLAFFAIYVVWGTTYLAIRYAVETIPPLITAGVPLDCGDDTAGHRMVSRLPATARTFCCRCRAGCLVLPDRTRQPALGRAICLIGIRGAFSGYRTTLDFADRDGHAPTENQLVEWCRLAIGTCWCCDSHVSRAYLANFVDVGDRRSARRRCFVGSWCMRLTTSASA